MQAPDAMTRRPTATRGCRYVARVRLDEHGRIFLPGDEYPYVELGRHEIEAYKMHRAGLLAVMTDEDCMRLDIAAKRDARLDELVKLSEEYGGYDEPVAPTESRVAVIAVSPGETVRVETPSQRDARRNKRR